MSLHYTDPEIASIIEREHSRQQDHLELIASENIVSKAVLEAQGSILTNKYAEGYPGKRYYAGCEAVDLAEELARDRVKRLFSCSYANVQPHSGSQANQAVFLALLKPNDAFLGMDLKAGGHLTHGSPVNLSGKWFQMASYGVDVKSHRIDYDEVLKIAKNVNPRLIIAGGSAYPRKIDFKAFREIADVVGAYLMVDMAHFAGLVAGGVYPSPLPYAHIVTSTTHKTLRGPRGGLILSNEKDLFKRLDSAVFPGLQGGPLMHVIAAKAVAFGEALSSDFKRYAQQVLNNAKILAETLINRGIPVVTEGTDTHLLLANVSAFETGKEIEARLSQAGIICNKNGIPFDELPPTVTSGIRLGSPAATTRGMGEDEFRWIGETIADLIQGHKTPEQVYPGVVHLCRERFPFL